MATHPTNPALNGEGQPAKGQTATSSEGQLLYKDSNASTWRPAVRMNDIRANLIARAAVQGTYTHERPSGLHPDDKTAFLQEDKDYGEHWDQRPPTVFQVRPTPAQQLRKPGGVMVYNNMVVLDPYDHPIRQFPELPDCLSTKTSGMWIEHYLRKNLEIKAYDLMARMMDNHVESNGNVHPGAIRINTLTERATKFRTRAALPAFSKRGGSDAKNKQFLKLLPLGAKSTRSLGRDRRPAEVKELLAPSKGTCPNKARKSKRYGNASQQVQDGERSIEHGLKQSSEIDNETPHELERVNAGLMQQEIPVLKTSGKPYASQLAVQSQVGMDIRVPEQHQSNRPARQQRMHGTPSFHLPGPYQNSPYVPGSTDPVNFQPMQGSQASYLPGNPYANPVNPLVDPFADCAKRRKRCINLTSPEIEDALELSSRKRHKMSKFSDALYVTSEQWASPSADAANTQYPLPCYSSSSTSQGFGQARNPLAQSPQATQQKGQKRGHDQTLIGAEESSDEPLLKRKRMDLASVAAIKPLEGRARKLHSPASMYQQVQLSRVGVPSPRPAVIQTDFLVPRQQMPRNDYGQLDLSNIPSSASPAVDTGNVSHSIEPNQSQLLPTFADYDVGTLVHATTKQAVGSRETEISQQRLGSSYGVNQLAGHREHECSHRVMGLSQEAQNTHNVKEEYNPNDFAFDDGSGLASCFAPLGTPTYPSDQPGASTAHPTLSPNHAATVCPDHQDSCMFQPNGFNISQPDCGPHHTAADYHNDMDSDNVRNLNSSPNAGNVTGASPVLNDDALRVLGDGSIIDWCRPDLSVSMPVVPVGNQIKYSPKNHGTYPGQQDQDTNLLSGSLDRQQGQFEASEAYDSCIRNSVPNPHEGGPIPLWTQYGDNNLPWASQNQDSNRSTFVLQASQQIDDPSLDLSGVGQQGLGFSGDVLPNLESNQDPYGGIEVGTFETFNPTFSAFNQNQDHLIGLGNGTLAGQQCLTTGGAALQDLDHSDSPFGGIEEYSFDRPESASEKTGQYEGQPTINEERTYEAPQDAINSDLSSLIPGTYLSSVEQNENDFDVIAASNGRLLADEGDMQLPDRNVCTSPLYENPPQPAGEQSFHQTAHIDKDLEYHGSPQSDPFSSVDLSGLAA